MNIENHQIHIFTPLITNRIRYIFQFIFDEVLGLQYTLTSDIESFIELTSSKIAYGVNDTWEHSAFVEAHALLHESTITEQNTEVSKYQDCKIFFKTSEKSILPFDVFAASFYLISRYEEYLPFKADQFGRFPATESLAFKEQFLEIPIVDEWCILLKNKLLSLFPELKFKPRKFSFLSTIDIDNAYAHMHKGFGRTTLSLIKLLLNQPAKFSEKIKVLRKKIPDPYDNYEYLHKLHQNNNIQTIYFILFSKYGKLDKNLPMSNNSFHKLIRHISTYSKIGIHPSYRSNKNFEILKEEKEKLEQVINQEIKLSRQHFLKLRFPQTYENLLELGITEDYSMGYSSLPGFRAGTCTPFKFFNLQKNEASTLMVVPFSIIDVCFKDYLKSSPSNTLIKIKKIISSIKKVDGLFVSLWHNETLNPSNNQLSWRHVYEGMLDATKNGS